MTKPRIATVSLAGCFGCHMSILDIDERILQLAELVEFDRSPINDYKEFTGRCAVGIVEGGCCNEENVRVLEDFRKHCDVLVSLGDCAINGGIPAMRNHMPLRECLEEAYLESPGVYNPGGIIPNDPEIPLLLQPGLSVPRGGQDRPLHPRLPAAGRRDLERPGRVARRASPSRSRTPD